MSDTPPSVRRAFERMAEQLSKPPAAIMSQEEFDNLSQISRSCLTCNMPGCPDMVSTHHQLCVKHTLEFAEQDKQRADTGAK